MCASNPLNCIFLSLWHFWQKALVVKIFLSFEAQYTFVPQHSQTPFCWSFSAKVCFLCKKLWKLESEWMKIYFWSDLWKMVLMQRPGNEMSTGISLFTQTEQGSSGSQYSTPLHWYSKDICSCAIKEEDIRAIRGEGAWIDGEMLTSVRSPTNIPSRPFYSPIAA